MHEPALAAHLTSHLVPDRHTRALYTVVIALKQLQRVRARQLEDRGVLYTHGQKRREVEMVAIVRRMREGGIKKEIQQVASKMIWAAKKDLMRRNMQKKMDDRLKRLKGLEEQRKGTARVMWELTVGKNLEKAIDAFSQVANTIKLGGIVSQNGLNVI